MLTQQHRIHMVNRKDQNSKKLPIRQTMHLRKGRISIPHARYFITCTTRQRMSGLSDLMMLESIRSQLRVMQLRGDFNLHCATVMPDHIHLLFTLGERLTVSQIIGKLKSQTKATLDSISILWQDNFFEHRLRPNVEMEGFARYIFLNPYRKKLLSVNEVWIGWILNKHYRPEFIDLLIDGKYPHSAWLAEDPVLADLFAVS